jgi:hypothetical protein
VIEGGRLERASRGFYRRSGLARGLGFRWNRTDEDDAVFGPVSCSRWKMTDRWVHLSVAALRGSVPIRFGS